MRGSLIISLIGCLMGAALVGCVSNSANDLANSPGDRFTIILDKPAGTQSHPAVTAKTSSAPQPSQPADMDAAIALAQGIPYWRSGPHKVAPFPLVLNRTVQQYVDEFAEHNEGIKGSFRRSRPYLPAMVRVLENHDLPPELFTFRSPKVRFRAKEPDLGSSASQPPGGL